MSDLLYKLQDYLYTSGNRLELSMATGCRCMSCNSYKFRDRDGKIVAENEEFAELMKQVSEIGDENG
jgi:hypothetical protein